MRIWHQRGICIIDAAAFLLSEHRPHDIAARVAVLGYDRFDIAEIVRDYRAEVDDRLPPGCRLVGDNGLAIAAGTVADWADVRADIAAIDLWSLASRHRTTGASATYSGSQATAADCEEEP